MSEQEKMVENKMSLEFKLLLLLLYFVLFFPMTIMDNPSLMRSFPIFFVCSVGEPGEERTQGLGSTAGV